MERQPNKIRLIGQSDIEAGNLFYKEEPSPKEKCKCQT